MEILKKMVGLIQHDLRVTNKETYYVTAKASGLRPEAIHKIEGSPMQGSAGSLQRYIDSYCDRFPARAYKLFYNAAIDVAQQKVFD